MTTHRLGVDLTSMCNLRCSMCALHAFHPAPGTMPMGLLDAILGHLGGFEYVHVGWIGEPMCHPHFAEAIRLLKAAGPRLEVTTNGTLLDAPITESLIETRLDVLNVSIDGSTPERYARIRVGGALPGVIANVRRYLTRRSPGQIVNMIATVHAGNVSDMPSLALFARDNGFDNMAFNFAVPHFRGIASADSDAFDAVRAIEDARAAAGSFGKRIFAPTFSTSAGCAYLTPAVTTEGEVVPCCMRLFERDSFLRGRLLRIERRSFGNVGVTPLPLILESPAYTAFVETARVAYLDTCGPCALATGCFCP